MNTQNNGHVQSRLKGRALTSLLCIAMSLATFLPTGLGWATESKTKTSPPSEGISRLRQLEVRLSSIVQEIQVGLQGVPATKFIAAQDAWIRYRDAQCAFDASKHAGPGEVPSLADYGCSAKLTEQRVRELEGALYLREAADVKPLRKTQGKVPVGDIHAIAVYEGIVPDGRPQGFRMHPQGFVHVRVQSSAKPISLLLMAYEPVEWRLTLDSGAQVQSVILRGFYEQTVSGLPNDIPIQSFWDQGGGWQYFNTAITSRGHYIGFLENIKGMLGVEPITTQSKSAGKAFIVDGQRTISFSNQHGVRPKGPVIWKSVMEPIGNTTGRPLLSQDRLTTTYCCAGAFTESKATVGYNRGKWYAEFHLSLPKGAETARDHTNVGLMTLDSTMLGFDLISDSPSYGVGKIVESQAPFADQDIIGLAMDLDRGRLYIRRNGSWLNGDPTSGTGGIILRPGRDYVAAVTVGSPEKNKEESDHWTANFGATPFAAPPPKDYKPYDDSQ